jgi:hypothetical protein
MNKQELIKYIKLLKRLLVCYRLQRRPPEKLLDDLTKYDNKFWELNK